ncbi:MAG: acyl carrier protein [Planctomycetes bacterium]|nr:acyl carrier protein [Planctomycetota bacterium]
MIAAARAIHDYIREEILAGAGEDLTETTPLLELGILDSFSMLKLVGWLEERYSVQVDSGDLTAENFATVADIGALVSRYVERAAGS